VDPAWVTAAVALVCAVCGLVAWAGRWAWRILRRTTRFLDDYFGEPAHDGLAARPGVMTRLQTVEHIITEVHGQVFPNGGTSLRDLVHQTATDVSALRGRVELFEHQREGRAEEATGD
jgi:hypothetical protein